VSDVGRRFIKAASKSLPYGKRFREGLRVPSTGGRKGYENKIIIDKYL
jgi:hypothetical protein